MSPTYSNVMASIRELIIRYASNNLRFRFIGLNNFMDLRALDVCLAMNTRGDNGVSF